MAPFLKVNVVACSNMQNTVSVSERTVFDPFFKHVTVGYVVTSLRLVTT